MVLLVYGRVQLKEGLVPTEVNFSSHPYHSLSIRQSYQHSMYPVYNLELFNVMFFVSTRVNHHLTTI